MSKTIKGMMMRDYRQRLAIGEGEGGADAMVIGVRGLKGIETTRLRADLASRKIRVLVVRNALARSVMKGTRLEPLADLLSGSSALAYSTSKDVTVIELARELVKVAKASPKLELKGAVLDGTLFAGRQAVEELAKYPTRAEALSGLVSALLGPGRSLAAQVRGPGGVVAGLVRSIESKLEKGETIARAS